MPASVVVGYSVATAQFDSSLTAEQVQALQTTLLDKRYSALTVAGQLGTFKSVFKRIIGVLNAFAVGVGTFISNVLDHTGLSGLSGLPGSHIMQFAPASIAIIVVVVMLLIIFAGTSPALRAKMCAVAQVAIETTAMARCSSTAASR
ncbi:hypothetical protein [Glaciibacter psychrotolerans]|uniref:Uncharacterized protein n=1 Tax=Glaciibacter psychrotolerans TaxID=670054 RepID=A0A7Z0ECS1_9MICO|nr:hypothetical protein [Leifsonia psychrotolerans]NYJ18629.1 hypothetical protein [Leifsonia psychrotolerans]